MPKSWCLRKHSIVIICPGECDTCLKAFGWTGCWLKCAWKQLKTFVALDCGTRICLFLCLSDTLYIQVLFIPAVTV